MIYLGQNIHLEKTVKNNNSSQLADKHHASRLLQKLQATQWARCLSALTLEASGGKCSEIRTTKNKKKTNDSKNFKNKLTMKKTVIILSVFALILSSCKQTSPTMTMTTSESALSISLLGRGNAIIDWGDKTPSDTVTISENSGKGNHIYADTGLHTITITGDNVTYLGCYWNRLTSIDVSKNAALERLNCGDNQLITFLDVSKNTALTELICWDNQLTFLDVSKNTKLRALYCNHNQLTSLDVSKNQTLVDLTVHSNKFNAVALNTLFETLHDNIINCNPPFSFDEETKKIDIANNPGTETCNRNIAADKGWRVSVLNPDRDWSAF